MAQRLEILIDGHNLDLEPNAHENFYITRQVHDLRNLETRNADFTKQIKIPATLHNIARIGEHRALGNIAIPAQPVKQYDAEIRFDGATLVSDAKLLITESDAKGFFGQLLFGNYSLYDSLGDKLVSDIDFSDLDFDYTPAGLRARMNNISGLVTPFCDWTNPKEYDTGLVLEPPPGAQVNRADWVSALSSKESGFFLYFSTILERLVAENLGAGYILDLGSLATFNEWNQLALACPVQQFTPKATGSANPLNADVHRLGADGDQVYDGNGTGGTPFRVIWPTVNADPFALWDNALNQYDVGVLTFGVTEISFSATFFNQFVEETNTPDSFLRLVSNLNGTLDEINLTQDGTPFPSFFTLSRANYLAVSNEIFYIEVELGDGPGNNGDIFTHIGNDNVLGFSLLEQGQIITTTIEVKDWIPELSQKDFVRGLFAMFNVIPFLDVVNRTLFLKRWDRIPQEQEQDLSDRLDVGLSKNKIEVQTFFEKFGRNNTFKYTDDDTTLNGTELANTVVPFSNETLQENSDIIELPFAASDVSPYFLFTERNDGPLARIPAFTRFAFQGDGANVDIGVDANIVNFDSTTNLLRGDYIRITGAAHNGDSYMPNFIESINSPTQIRCSSAFSASTISASNWKGWRVDSQDTEPRVAIVKPKDTAPFSDMYIVNGDDADTEVIDPGIDSWMEAYFDQRLYWGGTGGLIDLHYSQLIDSLENPLFVRAFFRFDPVFFENLDFFRPVYISALEGFFYINKIEQYKPGKVTRVELVRIGKTF